MRRLQYLWCLPKIFFGSMFMMLWACGDDKDPVNSFSEIEVMVKDLEGKVYPDVKLTLTGSDGTLDITTDMTGKYTTGNLKPGDYTLDYKKPLSTKAISDEKLIASLIIIPVCSRHQRHWF